MTNTNFTFSGSGTAADPYTYNFHATGQSVLMPHMTIFSFLIGIIMGFCLGLLFFWLFQKRKSN